MQLLYHCDYDYVKSRSLTTNVSFQFYRRYALQNYHQASRRGRDELLHKLVSMLDDKHVRLETIPHPDFSTESLYEEHFRLLYQSFIRNLPSQSSVRYTDGQPAVGLLDSQTLLWRIPSCHVQNLSKIETLLGKYQEHLQKIPYWIIDIRGNGGGTDRIWRGFWPYLSSGTLLQGGTVFRASQGNIDYFSLAFRYARLWNCQEDATWYATVVRTMKQKGQGFVLPPIDGFLPNLHMQSEIFPNPKRVAVLIDQQTASAAETLIEMVKQSMKGIIIGQHASMGSVDSGNLRYSILPSHHYALYFGTSINLNAYRVAIDRSGYQPDILLPQGDSQLVIPWTTAYLAGNQPEMQRLYQRFSPPK